MRWPSVWASAPGASRRVDRPVEKVRRFRFMENPWGEVMTEELYVKKLWRR